MQSSDGGGGGLGLCALSVLLSDLPFVPSFIVYKEKRNDRGQISILIRVLAHASWPFSVFSTLSLC